MSLWEFFLFAYLLFEDVFFYVVLIFILRSGNDVVTEWYRKLWLFAYFT